MNFIRAMLKKRNDEGDASTRPEQIIGNEKVLLLRNVLKKNGEEKLFRKIKNLANGAEEDPPLIFGWENIEPFLNAANTAQGVVPAPPPTLILRPNMNVRELKVALLSYVRVPDAAAPCGTSVLPCTIDQYGHCISMLKELEFHPWTQYIIAQGGVNILPIATMFVPKPRSNTVKYALPAKPNTLWQK
jgi:hypothetical protein